MFPHSLFLAIPVIPIPKDHLAILDALDPPVGDRSAGDVAGQVASNGNTMPIAFLNADVPVDASQTVQQPMQSGRRQPGRYLQLSGVQRLLEQGPQLSAKDGHQLAGRQQRAAFLYHQGAVVVQDSGRHQTMHIRMHVEVSAPAVQSTDDAGSRSQVLRITQQCLERFTGRPHQQASKQPAVELPHSIEFFGDRGDDVHMIAGQQFMAESIEPSRSAVRALRG